MQSADQAASCFSKAIAAAGLVDGRINFLKPDVSTTTQRSNQLAAFLPLKAIAFSSGYGCQQCTEIIGDRALDGAVEAADALAGMQHIPKRNPVFLQVSNPFSIWRGERNAEEFLHDAPKLGWATCRRQQGWLLASHQQPDRPLF